jgi:drug/metabolite transporter (DMT)-like permease
MRQRIQPWLLFGLLVLAGALRWMVAEARPDSESTLASLTLGCGWAALVSLMLLTRGPAQAMVRRSWLGLLAGALLFAGPAAGLLLHAQELNAAGLTMALTLTPVAVGVAAAALGGGEMGGGAGRVWPGLAALGGLLLLLAEPALGSPRADLAMFLAPALTGAGAALLCLRGPSTWRATTALSGGAALFAIVLLADSFASGVRPRVSLTAVACDGVMALLSVFALLRVGAARWSAQFALLPLLIVLEGILLVRPVFTARWVVGLSLLALASVYLLLPPADDGEAGATVVPPR